MWATTQQTGISRISHTEDWRDYRTADQICMTQIFIGSFEKELVWLAKQLQETNVWIQSCPLIAYGETTPKFISQYQNKFQPQNNFGDGTSPSEFLVFGGLQHAPEYKLKKYDRPERQHKVMWPSLTLANE